MRNSENMGKQGKRKYSRGMGSPILQPSSLLGARVKRAERKSGYSWTTMCVYVSSTPGMV